MKVMFASSKPWKCQWHWVKKTIVCESVCLSKLGNTGLYSWWSCTHSLEECSTSRVAPRRGHLPLSPTHLTSTPAVGQWTCNLVTAGHQPGRHTHTHTPHPAAAALQATPFAFQPRRPPAFPASILTHPVFSSLTFFATFTVWAALSWWHLVSHRIKASSLTG